MNKLTDAQITVSKELKAKLEIQRDGRTWNTCLARLIEQADKYRKIAYIMQQDFDFEQLKKVKINTERE